MHSFIRSQTESIRRTICSLNWLYFCSSVISTSSPLRSFDVRFVFKIYRLLFSTLLDFCQIGLPFVHEFCWSLDFIFLAAFHCIRPTFLLFLANWNWFRRVECPDFARLVCCSARFWWRVLLSCRLTRLDFNSVSYCASTAVLVIFQAFYIVFDQHFFCSWAR